MLQQAAVRRCALKLAIEDARAQGRCVVVVDPRVDHLGTESRRLQRDGSRKGNVKPLAPLTRQQLWSLPLNSLQQPSPVGIAKTAETSAPMVGPNHTANSNAGPIEGVSGVGNISMEGLEGTVKSRAVGGRVTGKGRGQQPIEVKIGVGDLVIELTQ